MHILLHMKAIERSEVLRSSSPILTGLEGGWRGKRGGGEDTMSGLNDGTLAFPSSFDLLYLVIIIRLEYGQLGTPLDGI